MGIPKPVSPGGAPNSPNLLDELVGAILSQSTTVCVKRTQHFHNSSRAFRALKAAYPHWEQVLTADPEVLASILRPGGLANLKAARIQELLVEIQERQGSLQLDFLAELDTKQALDYLLSLKGVGLKTATCVWLGRDLCPVDTHGHRVANRLGLVRTKAPDDTFVQLSGRLPAGKAYSLYISSWQAHLQGPYAGMWLLPTAARMSFCLTVTALSPLGQVEHGRRASENRTCWRSLSCRQSIICQLAAGGVCLHPPHFG